MSRDDRTASAVRQQQGSGQELSALGATTLAGRELDNRLAFLATVNNLGRNHEVTDEQVGFYEARARGGTGLIITESLSVHPSSFPNQTVPFAYEPDMVQPLRRIADAVHAHDRSIYGQLWHVGRQALWNTAMQAWSASGERDPYSGTTPHVMTDAEILDVIDGYRRSAVNLRDAGYDGVELHGAHGYLITQFLSPSSNRRSDRWGGSVANRARLVTEIVRAIRADCGESFGIGLKLTVHEYVDGGLDLELSQETVDFILGEVALDYIAVSQANFSPSLEYHVPDLRFPDVPFEQLAVGIKEVVGDRSQLMALCKVPDVETASRLIDQGTADLVGMGRALLADPEIVNKVREGRQPRPCIYCNICWEYIHTGRPAYCVYSPDTARETEQRAGGEGEESSERLRVEVHGAGPAGLEYARIASQRGHDVEVRERSARVGGRFDQVARTSGLERYGAAVEWLSGEATAAGARIVLDAEDGGDSDADVTVIATGREPVVEPLEGCVTVSLEQAQESPDDLVDPIFVIDEIETEPAYGVVEELTAAGHDVRLVTRRASIGRLLSYISLIGALRRLDDAGIRIHTLLAPVRVEDGRLIAVHSFSKREHDLGEVGTVVRAGPYAASFDTTGPGSEDVVVIGDASAPREALAVVYEANRRAAELPVVAASATDPIGVGGRSEASEV